MPKASIIQAGFTTGEVSPLCYGAVDNPRYKKGLARSLNYLLTLQGPTVRRPATKYCANVKDSANPPVFIPFRFSKTQNYQLEFGGNYVRFYTNNGQVVTSGTSYQLTGNLLFDASVFSYFTFYATRATTAPSASENITATTTIANGSILELQTPYAAADVAQIRYSQNGDTIYLTHSSYPPMKLQRQDTNVWKLSTVYFIDGPYLPANSFATVGDSISSQLAPLTTGTPLADVWQADQATIASCDADPGGSGQIQVSTTGAHQFVTGQNIFISGVTGTTEANNWSSYSGRTVSSTHPPYWVITVTSSSTFLLNGSIFINAYGGSGGAHPALFALGATLARHSGIPLDIGRSIALQIGGKRYWGNIYHVYDAITIQVMMGGTAVTAPVPFPSTATADQWFLGVWYGAGGLTGTGYPAVSCFHQNRLWYAGSPYYPQEVDSSNTGLYDTFSPSPPGGSSALTVIDSNSCQFTLNSEDLNPLAWLASTAQGLIASSAVCEWAMTPSGGSEALTPTNFNAQQTSFYGSAYIAPVKVGNAVLYMQNAQRKVREMTFFFYAGTFRSTDLTEISEHITLPAVTKLAVQKETQPIIWGLRSDGALVSLIYNRDDVSLSVGWTRHQLGGRSDSAGSPPVVYDIGMIPDPTGTFDQLWMIVKRYINGATVYTIEYLTKIFDDSMRQDDAFQGDCGGTYDVPLTITAITAASPPVVTSTAHGLTNGKMVKITNVVGLNLTTTDINGNKTISNAVNELVFTVAGVTTNTFQLQDASGNALDFSTYSAYVSGGQARKLVTTISGLTWLENETVQVLTDGGNHPDVVVGNSGTVTLQWPAAKVQLGYAFPSQGQLLRSEAGSATGTSMGQTRRAARAAVQVHNVAELSIGMDFTDMIPVTFTRSNVNSADRSTPLWSGIVREGLNSIFDFDNQFCFQQTSMLPGTIQSIAIFEEEQDV